MQEKEDTFYQWATKKEWAESLQVGDFVYDCRNKHLKVTELYGEKGYDIQLTLEDGSSCSAMNCCDPFPC